MAYAPTDGWDESDFSDPPVNVHDKYDSKPTPQFKISGDMCPACKDFFTRGSGGYDRHWQDVLRTRRL